MSAPRKVSDEDVATAYRETGSVWKAGKRLGVTGQSVWERLKALGHPLRRERWTQEELAELKALSDAGVQIGEMARRLNRPYAGVALKLSRYGWVGRPRKKSKKLPRGAGYDKVTTLRRMTALEQWDGSLRQFCRSWGIAIDAFATAAQNHCPERWTAYTRSRSDIGAKQCPYCAETFYPLSAKQKNCTRRCSDQERADRNYFAGNRRNTIGLASGICQLCERQPKKGLSSHHVVGKEADPDGEWLIALCSGCHKLVTLAATRKFDAEHWEHLINLVMLRRHESLQKISEACVEIEVRDYDPEIDGEEESYQGQLFEEERKA